MEYSTAKYHRMNVLHVLVYLRMILSPLSGLNAPMRIVECGVMQTVWRNVTTPMFV